MPLFWGRRITTGHFVDSEEFHGPHVEGDAGKLIGSVVASYDRGLTVTDHIRTVARQYYAWSLPYAVSFQEKVDILKDGTLPEGSALGGRLEMMAHDMVRYGMALKNLREESLSGTFPVSWLTTGRDKINLNYIPDHVIECFYD